MNMTQRRFQASRRTQLESRGPGLYAKAERTKNSKGAGTASESKLGGPCSDACVLKGRARASWAADHPRKPGRTPGLNSHRRHRRQATASRARRMDLAQLYRPPTPPNLAGIP